jgi:multisubunit Na+/H+ antiporter MnhB subunit
VRIREVLDALAVEAREEADRRESVDASRASARSQMRSVAVSAVLFMVAFAVVGHGTPLLSFYDGVLGQLVLLLVAAIMGSGIWLMGRMVRPTEADRILLVASDEAAVVR